jgi:hypothetical protein
MGVFRPVEVTLPDIGSQVKSSQYRNQETRESARIDREMQIMGPVSGLPIRWQSQSSPAAERADVAPIRVD